MESGLPSVASYPEVQSPPPDLEMQSTRSVSFLPKIGRRKGANKSLPRLTLAELPISEAEEVQRLNLWSRTREDRKSPSITSGFEKVQMYRGRFSDLDRIVSGRKTKSQLPPLLTRTKMMESERLLDTVTCKRVQKVASETDFREKTKYSKVYEDELVASYSSLQSTLDDLQSDREDLSCSITDLYASLQTQQQLLRQHEIPTPSIPKDIKKALLSQTIKSRKGQTPRVKSCTEVELKPIKEIEEEKERLGICIETNTRKVREIDAEVKKVKAKMKEVREAQVRHYMSILSEGTDSRSEGLAWVLKALWTLGQHPGPEAFPSFLSLQTIDLITQIAEKTKEADALSHTISIHEKRQRRMSITARSHPDRWNKVQDRLKRLGKKIVAKGETGAEEVVEGSLEGGSAARMQELVNRRKEEETREQELRKEVAVLQEAEVKRLIHECCFNGLEKASGVSLRQMLSAFLGVEVISRQMSTIAKEQKCLIEELEKTRTYCFGGSRKNP